MLTIPLAFVGTVVTLKLAGLSLSVVVFLGMIMLAGIVVNNAIVLVDYINRLRDRGLPRDEAIVKAGSVRLRPILMTTATTVLGLAPMALGLGEGSELRAPMALMVMGGLLVRALIREKRRDAQRLRIAAGEFYEVVQDNFERWGLTPSERDVAMFMLKGLSNHEIAALRETSEGTIKAQSTAIFRKAGVSGRTQLFSLFIEELLEDASPYESAGRIDRKTA